MKNCPACKQDITIKLMPDFSSEHLWCGNCGVGLVAKNLGFSDTLILLIRNWGLLWDVFITYKTSLNVENYSALFEKTGKQIQSEIEKMYPCRFTNKLKKDLEFMKMLD